MRDVHGSISFNIINDLQLQIISWFICVVHGYIVVSTNVVDGSSRIRQLQNLRQDVSASLD